MSKIIKNSYFYKTNIDFSPNLLNLSLLYKPIIGNDAYLLYIEMLNDSKINTFNIENKKSLYDLFKKLNLSVEKFHENRKILEAMDLISTYLDDFDENEKKYFFVLKSPLEFNHFVSNLKFKKLLISKITDEKFQELQFSCEKIAISNYAKDISVNFNEIFKNEVEINLDFNFEQIYSNIAKITSINVIFSEKVKNIINSFYKNFSLTISEIEKCILPSIIKNNNDFVVDELILNNELTILTNKINNVNYYEILKINRCNLLIKGEMDNDLDKIFLDYNNIKSEQYLCSIQKQQLSNNQIMALKFLRRDLYLTDPIINLILDFSLRKTYGNININYIKKVARTISILNLESVNDVYDHLLGSFSNNKNNNKFNINLNNDNDDINIVELVI